MLQIKELSYYQPRYFAPSLFLISPPNVVSHLHHSSVPFFFRIFCSIVCPQYIWYRSGHTSHIKCRCWMLHLDIVYMARLLFASHLIKRWNRLLLTVCSSLPPHTSSVLPPPPPPPPWSVGQIRLDWNPHSSGGRTTSLPCGRIKALVSVCISFCCCSVCLRIWQQNCHLLCCTCLRLLRKLLQYLWLCNNECGGVCMCVCVWMRGSGKSSTHLTETFPVLLKFILYFSLVAICSPNQDFITKQVSSIYTDNSDFH